VEVDENIIRNIQKLKSQKDSNNPSLSLYIELIDNYISINQYTLAFDEIKEALRSYSQEPILLFTLAKLYFIKRMNKTGLYYLRKAFAASPDIRKSFAKHYPLVESSRLFRKLIFLSITL
jgi:hypothetical protein